MVKKVHVLIAGGGISGLSLANLLVHGNKKVTFHVTIFESRPDCDVESIGGGIGLWPPAQSVLKHIPDYLTWIEQFGFIMPFPGYRDSSGRFLARANEDFAVRYPVQCLERHDLVKLLTAGLKNRNDVNIITNQKIDRYDRQNDQILITSNNTVYQGDLLIACDGIHSNIRNCLMQELKLPPVFETDLGYTYFRANTTIPADTKCKWWSASFETWGTSKSEKYGHYELRFGYVPLKPPTVFWFIAIKTRNNHPWLSPVKETQLVGEDTREFLSDLVRTWKPVHTNSGDIVVNYEKLINLTAQILRTDIAKIENVTNFPWRSRDNRVVLMGDAAHATAPNIAQGAGLCIEDAACLASKLNRVDYLYAISEYEQERKQRAKRVQQVADFIATVGQLQNPLLRISRNTIMRSAVLLTPRLQRNIFEYFVSLSLGGSRKSVYWEAPESDTTDDAKSSLFARVFPDFYMLDNLERGFKTSVTGGSGTGVVTVKKPAFLARFLEVFAGFPEDMSQQPFYAEVVNSSKEVQRWKRIFGYNTPQKKTYITTHSLYCAFNRQMYLSEGMGGFLDKALRFIYKIDLQSDKSLQYKSQGITCFDLFKIPLSSFLLPTSAWTEKPIEGGWEFDGKISFPVIGPVFHYYGYFHVDKRDVVTNKRTIIAGGSGMIGKEVCLEFVKKGYDVYCLSRSLKTQINIEGVKLRLLGEDWSDLIDSNTIIINLSGANPGARRWTSSVKSDIAESRFRVIDLIIQNIERAGEKPLKYLQASAAGFYGDAGDTILTEGSNPVLGSEPGTKFRVEVCREIEKRAHKASCNVVSLRIGHVLSHTGSLLKYFRLSSFLGIGKFGTGNQFVPFVHIGDVAKAIEFIAHNSNIMDGAINITAPEPCRNFEMLKALQLVKWKSGLTLTKPVLQLLVGQSSVVLTDSERVLPKRLLENGFQFNGNTIYETLSVL